MQGVKGTGPFSKYGKGKKKSGGGHKIKKQHLQPMDVPQLGQPMYVPNVIVLTPEAVGSMIGVAIATVADKD